MADIFISYAREDAGWVEKLAAAIEAAGYSVWWDRNLGTGTRYLKETETQLRAAKATVVVWSKRSVESHWVADEAGLARDLGRIAPISMDGTMPPLGFGQYQATSFSHWQGGAGEPMATLLRALAEKVGQQPQPAAPAPKSIRKLSPLVFVAVAVVALAGAGIAAWSAGLIGGAGSERVAPGSASVAVTPFKDLSQAGDQAHLANGMTVEVLSRLRSIDKLKVAGGDWMAEQIKETGGDPQALGKQLDVNYILEGDIRTEGENLRVNARLVRASDRGIVWSPQPYERAKDSIFAIQDDIATSVANALSVTLDVGLQSTSYGGTKNFEAYDHFLRGYLLRNVGDPRVPVRELTQAVSLDPNYARAWSELTIAWGTVARLAKTPAEMEPSLAKMDEASQKAEALAPKMWFGHTPRGWYLIARNDWVNADIAHHKALDLGDVADAEFYQTEAAFANQVGRASHGARMIAKTLAVDPRYRGRDILRMQDALPRRDYDEVWKAYEASKQSAPEQAFLREYVALCASMVESKKDRTREILRTLGATRPFYNDVAARLDRPGEMLAMLRSITTGPEIGRGLFSLSALLAGQYGDPELAVQLLRRAYLGPGWAGQFTTWYPPLAEARKTAAFKQFVRDIGWEKMYRQSGDWGDFCKPLGESDFECS